MDDEHTVAVGYANPYGLLGSGGKELRPRQGARAKLGEVQITRAQLQELRAELILVAVGMLLDEPVLLERAEQSVHGALGKPEPPCPHQDGLRLRFRGKRAWRKDQSCHLHPLSAEVGHHALDVIGIAEHRYPADRLGTVGWRW